MASRITAPRVPTCCPENQGVVLPARGSCHSLNQRCRFLNRVDCGSLEGGGSTMWESRG